MKRRLPLLLAVGAGGSAVAAYAVGLGIYAVASTRGPIASQPRTPEEAQTAIRALGLEESYPFESRFLATPHGRMHYVEAGQGAPVLCLHGNPTWSFLYREFARELADRSRVIAPDLIGFGLSEKHGDPDHYTLEGHADDVAALIEALDLRDLTLVLSDWGGPIGLGAALSAPERVRRLVLINTFAFVSDAPSAGAPELVFRLARLPLAGEQLVQGLGLLTRVGLRDARRWGDSGASRAYRGVQGSWPERAGALAFPRLVPRGADAAPRPLFAGVDRFLGEFKGPALIVWGMRDDTLGSDTLQAWRRRLPQAEVLELEHAGRYPQEDAPEQVVARVRAFLEGGSPREPGATAALEAPDRYRPRR